MKGKHAVGFPSRIDPPFSSELLIISRRCDMQKFIGCGDGPKFKR